MASKCFIVFPSQKAFNEQFYEEDENEKPVFEDDLGDIGEWCVRSVHWSQYTCQFVLWWSYFCDEQRW